MAIQDNKIDTPETTAYITDGLEQLCLSKAYEYKLIGAAFEYQGDFQKALDWYLRAVDLCPKVSDFYESAFSSMKNMNEMGHEEFYGANISEICTSLHQMGIKNGVFSEKPRDLPEVAYIGNGALF